MTAPPDFAIRAAVVAGARSPCAKSKRGAAVFAPGANPDRACYGIGWNGQPEPFACAGTDACRAACGQLCLHAEHRAIHNAILVAERRLGRTMCYTLRDLALVHAKVVDDHLVAGGGPSCLRCSAEILDVGLAAVWLYEAPRCTCGRAGAVHDDDCFIFPTHGEAGTWRRYTAENFHRATLRHHGLEVRQ